jgi:hypothetical protein
MSHNRHAQKGRLVATALAGSWRAEAPPAIALDESELNEVTPLLCGSGAAGLGWSRIRATRLRDTPSAAVLQQSFRLLALQSAIAEEKLVKVFRAFRQSSIPLVLAKGWAAAQFYPDSAIRPYGDIDLLVSPADYKRAAALAESPLLSDCWIDLHKGFPELEERLVDSLFERSCLIELNHEPIRVLGAEDHLALIAIHLLKHGAWRPLWLCDVAAVLESLPTNFSWELCLGNRPKRARWITTTIALAHRLLSADVGSFAFVEEVKRLPEWVSESVLQQWSAPFAVNQPPLSHSAPISSYLGKPWGIIAALSERWPNPILATISVNGEFNSLPRLPYQLGNCALRMGQVMRRFASRSHST